MAPQLPAGLPAAKTSIPEHAIKSEKAEKPDVDHDEMRERLYRMASAMRQNGARGSFRGRSFAVTIRRVSQGLSQCRFA